ncbi:MULTISPECIES: 4'-phosphopantetheinyl transferase superfamily protein [Cryobacterium]|uniref:4'-phosphopantetheinyl transferase superfamily protein n=1 Tax=Cryobacterium breve TaxID=1259258 RepID=A0ABY2J6W8_9MICO|nr:MULTISPECIES: 4'-phosphopantetheinyl transferase superfamily protein [Cryobacterium]TFC96307.1 4'-phosphopantetheinyl transferase superfamily protein [Cryobacterium sp. TmT3-12]TFD00688.1 4'-phosphopantetheinyl transferase superfamily protein [Cryobacterium breve]
MNPDRAGDVVVVVGARRTTDAADRLLLAATAAWVLGVAPHSVQIERSCPHCGGRDHGRPQVALSFETGTETGTGTGHLTASRPLHVSLSRAGGVVALALTFLGPVGVDVETLAAVSRAGFDAVAFGTAELAALAGVPSADAVAARAQLWTAKEAALKCTGDGLRVDPRDLTVALPGSDGPGNPGLTAWRGSAFPVDALRLRGFEPGAGLVGTVAVLAEDGFAADGPTVRVVPAADIRR